MLLRCESLEPPMSQLGHERPYCLGAIATTATHWKADIISSSAWDTCSSSSLTEEYDYVRQRLFSSSPSHALE